MRYSIADFIIMYIVILLSLTVHESAHAWLAYRKGDSTARMLGRISLNPIVHIDLLGTVIFPILAAISGWPLIGWAKPVPVNPLNLRDPKRDYMFISASGPVSNLMMAVGFSLLFHISRMSLPIGNPLFTPFFRFLYFGVLLNVLLAVFNLIPIPPLDGSGVLMGLLSDEAASKYQRLSPFGIFILYILMFAGIFGLIIFPIVSFIVNLLI